MQWLKEIYTSQFNPAMDRNAKPRCLEEVRAVFRLILNKTIVVEWFESHMFSAPVTEALGLLLRNQLDRFVKAYYGDIFIQYPHEQATTSFIWRYVLDHVAYDNQQTYCELWRSDFNSRLGTMRLSQDYNRENYH